MRSTATELGTPSIRVSSVQSRACTPWNQVFQVASDNCARTAAATFTQRSSAAGVPMPTPRFVHSYVHTCGEATPPGAVGATPRAWLDASPRTCLDRGNATPGKYPQRLGL